MALFAALHSHDFVRVDHDVPLLVARSRRNDEELLFMPSPMDTSPAAKQSPKVVRLVSMLKLWISREMEITHARLCPTLGEGVKSNPTQTLRRTSKCYNRSKPPKWNRFLTSSRKSLPSPHRSNEFVIISGGQTGVDRAALDTAISIGVPHGGWCPKGDSLKMGPSHLSIN